MSPKTFYDQGKFMEDFEDDYEYKGDFSKYFPTYQSMNDQQLRGYFTWRTKVRKGDIEKTSLSFIFVYIYELLNGIGVNSPEAGYQALKNFWQVYQHFDNSIDFYMELWLKDYVIYHNLDKSLLKDSADYNFDNTVLTLLNYSSYTPDEIFNALNSLSSYNLWNSKFYKLYPDDVIQVVYSVFSKLTVYYNKNRKNNICEKFFGEMLTNTYTIFASAVFYDHKNIKDFTYEINSIYRYQCQDRKWSIERFISYKGKNKRIGELLKAIDFLMRKHYNFKSTLKVNSLKEIDRFLKN